ncbi:MAG: glycosyltransferase family 4 protein [Candidatus Omnitrophica bacterium]|jgi:glycosyltransferase involved in cell wall biosynthesis|nr:glycosyltransferase family 4 protein [Candidatus Omnitrophota bacterium]
MRILLLSTHLNAGGISRYILTLAKGLKKDGHEVWVSCAPKGEWLEKLEKEGIPYKTIPIKTKSILSIKIFISFFILAKFIKKERIEVIHSSSRVTQFLGFLLYKFTRVPYVTTFHGFYRKNRARKQLKFEGLRTIAISENVKAHLSKDLNIPEGKIRIVFNGICREEFGRREKTKIDYGFKEKDFVIGILGRISEEKGHFLAIEAFKLLSDKYNNVYLAISGKGKLEEELKTFIKLTDIGDKTKFFNMEAKDFLDIPDILIVPSKREGFGYVIVEAFLKEVPVIGFNGGAISEIIKNGENGLLFDKYEGFCLKQAIEQLMFDKTLCERIVKKAKEDAQIFSMENMALNTEKVYQEVI